MLAMPARRRFKAAVRSESLPDIDGLDDQAHPLLLSELKLADGLQHTLRKNGLGDLYHATIASRRPVGASEVILPHRGRPGRGSVPSLTRGQPSEAAQTARRRRACAWAWRW